MINRCDVRRPEQKAQSTDAGADADADADVPTPDDGYARRVCIVSAHRENTNVVTSSLQSPHSHKTIPSHVVIAIMSRRNNYCVEYNLPLLTIIYTFLYF